MKSELICGALNMTIQRRGLTPKSAKGLILQNDRGSQYCSKAYRKIIKKYLFAESMS